MAKKFGKFLLFTAAVGTAAAAAYYYMQQKDSKLKESSDADDDYDDFHEDLEESNEFSRNYVPLNTAVQTLHLRRQIPQMLTLTHPISLPSPIRQPICPGKRRRPWKA